MTTTDTARESKRIVIAIEADRLGALGLDAAPDPGQEFVLTGRARARDVYPDGQDGPSEATFELVPERLEPAGGAGRADGFSLRGPVPSGSRSKGPGARGKDDPEQGQKRREAFFRSLFREDA